MHVLFKKKEVPNKCIFLLVAQCGGKQIHKTKIPMKLSQVV
jgi:hypothetical protein